MKKNKPSDFHADLTEERIIEACQLIVKAYNDALEFFIEDMGDNRWSHGCRRWVWARKNIREAVELGGLSYLGIIRDVGNSFVFRIGDVPVKYKRTDPDEPDDSVIRQALCETQQLSLLEFAGISDPCELSWRVLIEDDFVGEVLRVVFVGIDQNKQARCYWELPRDKILPPISLVDSERDEGVELARPAVSLRNAPLEEAGDEAEETENADSQEGSR